MGEKSLLAIHQTRDWWPEYREKKKERKKEKKKRETTKKSMTQERNGQLN
jgi:hypothetical protein